MVNEKDRQFVQFIWDQTDAGKLDWESTSDPTKFIVSLAGKYKVTVDQARDPEEDMVYWLTLLDDADRKMLTVYGGENRLIPSIYERAQRKSRNVDAAIDEILSLGDDDIPY